ncbi:hypothetical protein B0H13DRAFT_2395200, partial [Mycena leptocephala]
MFLDSPLAKINVPNNHPLRCPRALVSDGPASRMISTLGRALALLALYLQASALISYVGLYGALKHNPSHVRFYRDCSAADLALTVLLTVLAAYAYAAPCLRRPAPRAPPPGQTCAH